MKLAQMEETFASFLGGFEKVYHINGQQVIDLADCK